MRQVVQAVLPLETGIILDPFMGAGSTLAAANAVGYASIGVERDDAFFELARSSISKLSSIPVKGDAQLFSSPDC
jgi:site-specific DNA-methyltransferase (adenine-specific)